MSKDPAFLMYSKDWITGTQFMSMEERGIYLTLVLAQHQNGHLDTKRVGFILGLSWDMVPVIVKEKFLTDDDGLIYNDRLDIEVEKRATYLSKQKENGLKGGRPKKPKQNPTANPNTNPEETMHVGNVNGNNVFGSEEEKGGMGEKTKMVFDSLVSKFDFNEQNHFNQIRELNMFCSVLQSTGNLDHFVQQREYYEKYKRAAHVKEHGFKNFLGTVENKYQDGGWNAENWKHNFETHGNNRQHINGIGTGASRTIPKIRDGDRKDFDR